MITPVQATNVDDDIKVQKNGKKIGENMLKCQIKGTEKNVGRRSRIGAGPSMAILLLFGDRRDGNAFYFHHSRSLRSSG